MLANGQQVISEIDLASIGMQEIKAQDTLFLYISNPQFLRNHQRSTAQLQLSLFMDGSLFPSHSSNTAVH